MNKTLTIVTALLVSAFIGYFATNQIVSNKASEQIERLTGHKLQELGVQYSDLRVNPAGGSMTLRNVQIDEAYAEELTVRASRWKPPTFASQTTAGEKVSKSTKEKPTSMP